MDNRGLTPVVGKTLEIGIVLLYVGLLTTVLYGGVVPEYRTTTGDAIGERTLATAAERVQQAVPPTTTSVDAQFSVDLPSTIRSRTYSIRAANRSLVLEHPHPAVGGRVTLALPETVRRVEGTWRSHESLVVRVVGTDDGLIVRLEDA